MLSVDPSIDPTTSTTASTTTNYDDDDDDEIPSLISFVTPMVSNMGNMDEMNC